MPKKEEEKKKFKAVTEEVTLPSKNDEVKLPEEKKDFTSIPETNNINSTLKKEERGTFVKIFVVTFFATLLAFLLAGGLYVYLTGTKGTNSLNAPTPTSSPAESTEPSPTATPNLDVSTYKVAVLNGNGGIGTATALKNIIEKVGFKVVYTGNADNFNFTDTIIQVKSGISADVVAKLKDALTPNYSVQVGDQLDATSAYDIVVTVGSK